MLNHHSKSPWTKLMQFLGYRHSSPPVWRSIWFVEFALAVVSRLFEKDNRKRSNQRVRYHGNDERIILKGRISYSWSYCSTISLRSIQWCIPFLQRKLTCGNSNVVKEENLTKLWSTRELLKSKVLINTVLWGAILQFQCNLNNQPQRLRFFLKNKESFML